MLQKIINKTGNLLFTFKNKNIVKAPKNILVMRSGAIGDVVMTTPLLRALRNNYPKAKITYLVGDWSKKVLNNNKDIDNIISFDDSIIYKKDILKLIDLIISIRKKRFDMCFILDKSYHFSLLAFFFSIRSRIGFDRKGEGFANTKSVYFDGSKYEVDYYLDLAKIVGAKITKKDPFLNLTRQQEDFADSFTKNIKGKIIGIAPGGAKNPGQEMSEKRWPLENYKKLIKKLSKKYPIILFGGPKDKELSKKLVTKNVFDSTGKTTIHESAALAKRCSMFITHDSGMMHIASTQTKVIALFGPTPAKRFAPRNSIVIESKKPGCPCYDIYGNYKKNSCMESITVEQVIKALKL